MNLLFISELSGLGGGEMGIYYLISELKKRHNCLLVCKNYGNLVDKARSAGIQVEIICGYGGNVRGCELSSLRRVIREFSPDAVFSNEPRTAVIVGVLGFRTKNYWICHGQWYEFSFVKKITLNMSVDGCLCVSNAVKRNLLKQGLRRCYTVNLGVPSTELDITPRVHLRSSLGVPQDELLVATVARFQPVKGQLKGVKAVERLLISGRKIRYLLVGGSVFNSRKDDEYMLSVKNYVKEHHLEQHVLFLGERGDVASILKNIDVLLVPSENESFGLVAIEALAVGTCIVSTPNDGVREIMEDNPLFISRSNTSESLADLLAQHFDQSFHARVKVTAESMREKYDVKKVAETVMSIVSTGN